MTDSARSAWSRVSHQGLQASFDDLYSATYRILHDAKTDHDLVKQYKGSHGSPNPHPRVADFGEFFFRTRRGLLASAASAVNPGGPAALADLDAFDNWHGPRVHTRMVFDLLAEAVRRPGESAADVFAYVTTRTHQLGVYRMVPAATTTRRGPSQQPTSARLGWVPRPQRCWCSAVEPKVLHGVLRRPDVPSPA